MADNFILTSLRGGANNTDPSIAIPDDQAVRMQNVELIDAMLGERRLGTAAVTLPAFLSARDRVTFLHRHISNALETDAELWALGITGTSAAHLGLKTTTWLEITISDTPMLTGVAPYRWQAASLHAKIHVAYQSDQDRLHVYGGSSTGRRSGLAEPPAAPTGADTAGAGTFAGTRYYRVRFTVEELGVPVRRSEPSDTLTFAPVGNKDGVTVTMPASGGEGETHWELEASTDNGNFYVIATTAVATTTATDNTAFSTGYSAFDLSEDIGDYALLWSARYVTVDSDRLIIAGSYEDDELAARVGWTPVFNAEGVGNDERLETDTDPTLDLDTQKYGPITGISAPVLGGIWVTEQHAVFKLTRTGERDRAYDADMFSDQIGAIHGSLLAGVDETGQPCLYAIDLEQGPYRIGVGGFKRCGEDLRATWKTANVNASAVVVSCLYYPHKKQVIWNLATGDSETPDTAIVLHVDKSRSFADGVRKGWVLWTGTRAEALAMCLYSDNINDNAARNQNLVPFIGLEGNGLIHQCDTGSDDAGDTYAATITTKPYVLGSILQQFEVRAAAVLGKAVNEAAIDVTCVRDFGLEETVSVHDVDFTPQAAETALIKVLDDFKGAEMHVGQVTFTDVNEPLGQWSLDRFDMLANPGQGA